MVFAVVMAATFFLLSPLEHRRLPWWDSAAGATGTRSTAAGVLICVAGVALVLLAKNGLDGVEGYAILGCFLAAAVAARVGAGKTGPDEVAGSSVISISSGTRWAKLLQWHTSDRSSNTRSPASA